MTKKKQVDKPKFPDLLFLTKEEQHNEEPFLFAAETIMGFSDGDDVAIYKLVEVKKMKITEELV